MSLPPSDSSRFRPGPDQLSIVGLQYEAHHGWYEVERDPTGSKNRFEVDVMVRGSFRYVQDLSRVPDYETMDHLIRDVMHGPSEKLIETLCQKIGGAIKVYLDGSAVEYVEFDVALRKMPPPIQTPSRYAEIRMSWVSGSAGEGDAAGSSNSGDRSSDATGSAS